MKHTKKQFALNVASGWGAQLVFAGVGFILLPYIIKGLGEQGYGIYQLARSSIVFFMFLQLGMGPTLIRYFSKAIATGDVEQLRRISSTAQFLLGGLGLFAALLCLTLIPFFVNFYNIPPELTRGTVGLLVCMAVSLFVNMTIIIPQGLVLGSNRYEISNVIFIITQLLRLGLIVFLFEWKGPNIFFIGLAMLISALWQALATIVVGWRYQKKAVFFSRKYVCMETLRSLLGFSLLNLVNSIAAVVAFQGPVLIIGKILGQEMVAAFAPALIISSAMQSILGQTARPLVPLASLDVAQGGGNLGKWAILMGQLCAFVGFGLVLPLGIFGAEIIQLWLGDELRWIWPIVVIISTGVAISQVQAANYFLAMGGGNIKPTVISQLVMAVIVFAGTWGGLQLMGWGLFYVATLIGVCIFIRNTLYLAYAYSKQFGYSFWEYEGKVYALPCLIFLFCLFLGCWLKTVLDIKGLWLFSGIGAIVFSVYIISWWFVLIPQKVKQQLTSFVSIKLGMAPTPEKEVGGGK